MNERRRRIFARQRLQDLASNQVGQEPCRLSDETDCTKVGQEFISPVVAQENRAETGSLLACKPYRRLKASVACRTLVEDNQYIPETHSDLSERLPRCNIGAALLLTESRFRRILTLMGKTTIVSFQSRGKIWDAKMPAFYDDKCLGWTRSPDSDCRPEWESSWQINAHLDIMLFYVLNTEHAATPHAWISERVTIS
jgi:hypothetical protein